MSTLNAFAAPMKSPARGLVADASASALPTLSVQASDRALWAFLVVGLAIAAICIYLFTTAEKAASNTVIATAGGYALSDNVPVVSIVGAVAILSAAYASYRAYKSFEGDAEMTAKRGQVLVLFALNMFLTCVWFNQYYAHSASHTQTSTTVALGVAATSGLLAAMFWNKDRVCAGFAAVNSVTALVCSYASYKLAKAT